MEQMTRKAEQTAGPELAARPPDDHTAIVEVLRGNRAMFEVLVRRYNQQLFRVGLAYLRQPEAVEDAMQNTYLNAYLHLSRFSGNSAFSTWLTRIMINECLMVLRRRRIVPDSSADISRQLDHHDQPSGDPHASSRITVREMQALLEQTIDELPEPQRVAYMLVEVQQMSIADAAECLVLSHENVRVRLHRARTTLKRRLLKSAAGAELFSYRAARCDRLTARVMASVLAAQRDDDSG